MTEEIIYATYLGGSQVKVTQEGVKAVLHTDYSHSTEFFSPGSMLCSAVGACMLSMMSVLAKRYGQNIEGTNLTVKPVFDPNGNGLQEMAVHLELPKGIDDEMKQRYIAAISSCPMHKSLRADIALHVTHN